MYKFFKRLIIFALIAMIAACAFKTPILKAIYPIGYIDEIDENSQRFNVDKYLVMGVISAESGFDHQAQSHKGAMGAMQVKEDTAEWCNEHFALNLDVSNLYNPSVNITVGCSYLEYLIDMFNGDAYVALAAYNAGLGNVKNWLKDKNYSSDGKTLDKIPFKETDEYVKKVLKRRDIYKKLYG